MMGPVRSACHGSRAVVVLVALGALVANSACGARWSSAERASVIARSQRTGAQVGAGAGDGSTASAPPTLPGATGSGTTPGGAALVPGGGSTAGVSTGGASSAGAAPGASPCAAPSTAPGVTSATLTVGSISTVSGPVPGLGETAVAAVRAYVAYRNATGGVCGRQIVLKTGDDGAENSRYRALVSDMASQAVGLAGGLGAGDGGGVDVVNAQNLPVVATAVSDTFQNTPTVFDINPPFANIHAVIGKYRYLSDHGVRTAAIVYLDNAQVRSQVEQQKAQMQAVGIRIVNEQALPLSTLSFDAAARAVANSKADYLFFPANDSLDASMARSMADTGYKLKFGEYLTAYGSRFIDLAGPAAEGATDWARSLPREEAASNPEGSAFLEWMGRAAPGLPADTFAADSWASAKAFFDNLTALPGPISRQALIAQLKSVGTYDAGGFIGPIQLGKKLSNGCYVAMQVVSGKWKRLAPDRGFLC